jgi:hypothetical protein
MMQTMLSMGRGFTRLEESVFSAICEMYPSERSALEAQLGAAMFQSRENTRAGFFTNFQVPRDGLTALGGQRLRNGPGAKIAGIENGMSFILWFSGGYADCLEGYCYGAEDTSEISPDTVEFEILGMRSGNA